MIYLFFAFFVIFWLFAPKTFKFGSVTFAKSFPVVQLKLENVELPLRRLSRKLPTKCLRLWFQTGTVVTLLALLASTATLIFNLSHLVRKYYLRSTATWDGEADDSMLQIVVPGYNLPLSDVGYYVITLIVASVFHELGHALPSELEKIGCLEAGIVIYLIVPAAYVNISTRELDVAGKFQKLKIFCGGVWHNVTLAALSFCLMKSLPFVLMPLYMHQNGIVVTGVNVNSSLIGPSGLQPGDLLLNVNNCSVKSIKDYGDCVSRLTYRTTSERWCIMSANKRFVKEEKNCCGSSSNSSELCFRCTIFNSELYSCLHVREELEKSEGFCIGDQINDCPIGYSCMEPILASWEKLAQIHRTNTKDFLFIGSPVDIYNNLEVSEYVWRLGKAPSWIQLFPRRVERLLFFTVILSSALGALNAIPCWRLDGQHIVEALFESSSHKVCKRAIMHFGTVLIALNLAFGLIDTITAS